MKAVDKRKIIIAIPVLLLLLSVTFMTNNSRKEDCLDETQIAELREKYPICGLEVPPTLEMIQLPLSQVKDIVETFVYGEVEGNYVTYSKKLSTGNTMLDEQRKENGISDEYSFYEYTVSVIDDTEGIMENGEKITISSNLIFIDYNPKLSDGMKVVVPIVRDEDVIGRTHYIMDGMYYVTEEGYVISVFDENSTYSKSKDVLNGVKVDVLLKKLKK